MITRRQQQGITMWGVLVIAILIGFFALLILKLFPPYMSSMKVQSILAGISEEASSRPMNNVEVLEGLRKRFDIDDIDSKINLREAISFERAGRMRVVRITYDDITPIFGNVFVLIEFDHSAEVGKFEE